MKPQQKAAAFLLLFEYDSKTSHQKILYLRNHVLKTMKPVLIYLLIVCLFSSCRKDIPAGIKTTITGLVFDDNKNQPVTNMSINIVEYKNGIYGPEPYRIIDSTISGFDGKYAITFTTTGKGIQYSISMSPGLNYLSYQSPNILPIGKDTTINFFAVKLSVLKADIQIQNNLNPPLRMYDASYSSWVNEIYGTNIDTVVFLKVIPNRINNIAFNVTNTDSPLIYNVRIDTLNFSGFSDTFNLSFNLDPSTFPLRIH
jgi:hypothetical protein